MLTLVEAVKAAHALSSKSQVELKRRIVEAFGPQTLPVKEASPTDKEVLAKKARLAAEAKATEEARLEAEARTINDIFAALTSSPDGSLPEEVRVGALRAIAEVIGVDEPKKVEIAPPQFNKPLNVNPSGFSIGGKS